MSQTDHWKMSISHAAKSDVGLRRSNNQDSFLVRLAPTPRQWLDHGHVFVVADGMGAHLAGEVASRLAAETIIKSYSARVDEPPGQALVQALYHAHNAIRAKSREEAFREMGTTCDAVVLSPQGLFIGHVGDSRVYRLRGTTFDQLTFDHSLVWEICSITNSPFDQPPSHIPKNQITRSLGPTEKLLVDLEGPMPIEVGDTYLLCSDGLSGQVSDKEIGQILAVLPPDIAAETLVNLANLRGGPDNITMVIVRTIENAEAYQSVDHEMQVPGWYWGILAGSLAAGLAAAACFVFSHFQVGALLALVAVAAGIAFFVMAQRTLFSTSPFLPSSVPSGNAPYRTWNCSPSAEFADALAKTIQELFNAAKKQQRSVSLQTAQRYENEAVEGYKKENFALAIRNYAQAINGLMREFKKENL
ncbi:MAG: protein phosphatase 2C domain-containing protein [Planctomycetaceae bacterium]|jgi:protein phosphatase|nr:protein phosphatase 2C domain-containing protein [Planctomycetaceae bacterium]